MKEDVGRGMEVGVLKRGKCVGVWGWCDEMWGEVWR